MNKLGHREVSSESFHEHADINIYNHAYVRERNAIVVKPTGPTSKHFALDKNGYADTSLISYEDPYVYETMYSHLNPNNDMQWSKIRSLINNKSNKWDDSLLLKWRPAKDIANDHILIIGQIPEDEVVDGFSFGDHWKKLVSIVEYFWYEIGEKNIIVKIHPSMKKRGKRKDNIDKWIQDGIDVRVDFESIHDFLPKTKVAIIENSTCGIDCLMHEVPVITYGWPEYHWVTKKLQTLPQLNNVAYDLSWHEKTRAKQFIYWYIFDYLCTDIDSTVRRLKELL